MSIIMKKISEFSLIYFWYLFTYTFIFIEHKICFFQNASILFSKCFCFVCSVWIWLSTGLFNRIKFRKLVKETKNIWHPFLTPRFSHCVLVSKLGEDMKNIYSIIERFFQHTPFSNSLAFVTTLSALCHVSSYLVLLFLTDLLKFLFSIFTPSVALDYWRKIPCST